MTEWYEGVDVNPSPFRPEEYSPGDLRTRITLRRSRVTYHFSIDVERPVDELRGLDRDALADLVMKEIGSLPVIRDIHTDHAHIDMTLTMRGAGGGGGIEDEATAVVNP